MDLTELFGSNVFNDKVMKQRMPKETYKALKETPKKICCCGLILQMWLQML